MLICSGCNKEKTLEEFCLRSDRANKHRTVCRTCSNERQRKNYYKRKKTNPFIFKHQKLSSQCSQKKLDYNLTPEFLKGIWSGVCPVSGEEIFISTSLETRAHPRAAELDRFVPELGYVKGNVTWISREFNMKKLNSSLDDLKKLVKWMEAHEPVKEAHAEIKKPKQQAWNKGMKMAGQEMNGEENPSSVLTEEQVRCIIKEYEGKRGQLKMLSDNYGVSPATIRKIIKRITWKHIEV